MVHSVVTSDLVVINVAYTYRVFQKKMHKVCHVINVKSFVLGLQCLHQNA